MKLPYLFATVLAMVPLASARAWISPAPDVVVYAEPMLSHAVRDVAAAYTAATGVPVHVFQRPGIGLIGLMQHTARDDVLVAGKPTMDAAVAQQLVKSGSVVPLGADPFVLIARDDASPAPSATLAQRLADHALVVTDATTAATFDGRAVLARAAPAATSAMGAADTPGVVFLVQQQPGRLGLVYRSDAIGAPHIAIAAAIATEPPTPIAAALVTAGQSHNAPAFLAYLASPAGAAIMKRDGLMQNDNGAAP